MVVLETKAYGIPIVMYDLLYLSLTKDKKRVLSSCIRSICEQTYHNLGVVLVDDGSIGNEGKICDDWAAKDLSIKVIHKINEGLVEARKTGITAASSDYIMFVDGDDYIEADYYEKLIGEGLNSYG